MRIAQRYSDYCFENWLSLQFDNNRAGPAYLTFSGIRHDWMIHFPRTHMTTSALEQALTRAKELHARMRADRECAVALGRFYIALLDSGTWDSQADVSTELSTSKAHVSKSIRAARLPETIQKVFGDYRRISFRTVDVLEDIAYHIGKEKLVDHASLRGEDFIRLYSPYIKRLNKNLPRVEDYVDFALKMMGYD